MPRSISRRHSLRSTGGSLTTMVSGIGVKRGRSESFVVKARCGLRLAS
jgi:hypothetical protein